MSEKAPKANPSQQPMPQDRRASQASALLEHKAPAWLFNVLAVYDNQRGNSDNSNTNQSSQKK